MTGVRGDARAPGARRGLRERVAGWGVRELVGAWFVYWIGLALYVVWPKLREIWVLATTDRHGSITLDFSGGLLDAALWIAGPPLVLALAWILTRPSRAPRRP